MNSVETRPTQDKSRQEEAECPCRRQFRDLSNELHDWLLTVEDRGVAGVVELLHFCDVSADCELQADQLEWNELPDFVAMHNWRCPADMHDLADYIALAIRNRSNARPVRLGEMVA